MSTRLGFLVATLALGSVLPLRAQQAGSIVVNASQVVAPVNRLVFGQNIEAADNARIFSSELDPERRWFLGPHERSPGSNGPE
jgi:hypothetical protein